MKDTRAAGETYQGLLLAAGLGRKVQALRLHTKSCSPVRKSKAQALKTEPKMVPGEFDAKELVSCKKSTVSLSTCSWSEHKLLHPLTKERGAKPENRIQYSVFVPGLFDANAAEG